MNEKWKQIRKEYSTDELMILGLVLSIFVSFYTTVFTMILIIGYLVRQNRLRSIIESVHGAKYLLIFCPLTLLISLFNLNSGGIVVAFAFSAIFLITLFIRTVMSKALYGKMIDLSCKASIFSFFVLLIERLINISDAGYRARSTFLNANIYACAAELVVLCCIYKLLNRDNGQRRKVITVMLINLCGLYLCNCRTAVLSLGIAVLALLFLFGRYRILGYILSIYALAAAAIVLFPDVLPRFDKAGVDLINRISIWKTAIRGIFEHPLFGQGGGTYIQIFSQYGGPQAMHAHNLILNPLLDFGVIGTALLLMYFKEQFKAMGKMACTGEMRGQFHLAAAVLACVFLHGTMDMAFFSVQTSLLLMAALSIVGISETKPQASTEKVPDAVWSKKTVAFSNHSMMPKH